MDMSLGFFLDLEVKVIIYGSESLGNYLWI